MANTGLEQSRSLFGLLRALLHHVLLLLDFTKLKKKAEEYFSRIFATYGKEILA
jgi:hypothetical protein